MLSLLDILFPDATMKIVKAFTPMNFTQPKLNLSDIKEKYNGWTDWTTWNCALWINNEQSIYNVAAVCDASNVRILLNPRWSGLWRSKL